MLNIVNTCSLVKTLLNNEPECRNSDEHLYRRIIDVIGFENGINIADISIGHFLENMNLYGVPKFETVRRARQRLQATYPELSADRPVEMARMMLEAETRAWARGSLE